MEEESKVLDIDGVKKDTYIIYNDGRLYSKCKGRLLKATPDSDGYLRQYVRNEEGNKSFKIYVHKMVLLSFYGKPPVDMDTPTVNHIDGNRTNNHISNLEWMSKSENSSKRFHIVHGEDNGRATINNDTAVSIYKKYKKGFSAKELSKMFNVKISIIKNIISGKNWGKVTGATV